MATDSYEIILTDTAKIELEKIYEYIYNTLKEPNSASRLMKKIEADIFRLEYSPYSCSEVHIKPDNSVYRKLVSGKYIILYRVDRNHKQVIIFNVFYGKKDYLS